MSRIERKTGKKAVIIGGIVLAISLLIVISILLAYLIPLLREKNSADSPEGAETPSEGTSAPEASSDLLLLSVTDASFTNRRITDESSAVAVLKDLAKAQNLSDSLIQDLVYDGVSVAMDTQFFRFEQTYKGLPVQGGQIVFSADMNGKVTSASVHIAKIPEGFSIEPKIDVSKMEEYLKECSDGETVILSDAVLAPSYKLMIAVPGEGAAILAYEVYFFVGDMECKAYVNALSGEIIDAFSLIYTYMPSGSNTEILGAGRSNVDFYKKVCDVDGNEYKQDPKNGKWYDSEDNKISYGERSGGGINLYDESGNFISYVVDPPEMVVYSPVEVDFDDSETATARELGEYADGLYLFYNELDRNGYDDKNSKVNIVYDYGNTSNSFSSGLQGITGTLLVFGSNANITPDLVAHEYTHSVEREISDLDYSGEPGAIKEGYSDIFGELFEDWYDDGQLNGTCDWVFNGIRNIENPHETKNPTVYKEDKEWGTTINWGIFDNGSVHNNSTVISHLAYLLVTADHGGTPLTYTELAELFFLTLEGELPANCSFQTLGIRLSGQAQANGLSQEKIDYLKHCLDEVGIGDGTSTEKVVKEASKFRLYDQDNNPLEDYTLTIRGTSRSGESVKKTITSETDSELSLGLKEGVYTVTVWLTENRFAKTTFNIIIDNNSDETKISAVLDVNSDAVYVVHDEFRLTDGFIVPVEQKTEVPEGYIGIYTAQDFLNIYENSPKIDTSDYYWSSHVAKHYNEHNNNAAGYILMNDITLPEEYSTTYAFAGVIDGNGYTIHNISRPLFYKLSGAIFYNLGIEISDNSEYTEMGYYGALGCIGTGVPRFENCFAYGSINITHAGGSVGSLFGAISNGAYFAVFKNCYSDVSVTVKSSGDLRVGGLCAAEGNFYNCYNSGNIVVECSGTWYYVGGLCGEFFDAEWCYNSGNITMNVNAAYYTSPYICMGGIGGLNWNTSGNHGIIKCCQNTGIMKTSWTVNRETERGDYLGGIVGTCEGITFNSCVNYGEISGMNYCGGISGWGNGASLTDCYNTGKVSSSAVAAGILGGTRGSEVKLCYNRGAVSGVSGQGALVGVIDEFRAAPGLEQCYYLESGLPAMADTSYKHEAKALSSSDMTKKDSYKGFDFKNVWKIESGKMPELRFKEIKGEE